MPGLSSGQSGSINVNIPTYSGAMKESLDAQVDLLTGSGDFAKYGPIGGLEGIVKEYERPLRMTTAQLDTDVLRQTLLGDRVPIYASEVTPSPQATSVVDVATQTADPLQQPLQVAQPETVEPTTQEIPQFESSGNRTLDRNRQIRAILEGTTPDNYAVALRDFANTTSDIDLASSIEGMLRGVESNMPSLTEDPTGFYNQVKSNITNIENEFGIEPLTETQRRVGQRATADTKIDYGGTVLSDGRVIVGNSEIEPKYQELSEILAKLSTFDPSSGESPMEPLLLLNEWAGRNQDDPLTQQITDDAEREKLGLFPLDRNPDGTLSRATNNQNQTILGNLVTAYIDGDSSRTLGKDDAIERIRAGYTDPKPIYRKNEDGTDFIIPKDEQGNFILTSDAGDSSTLPTTTDPTTTSPTTTSPQQSLGDIVGYKRAGTGMIDLLSDTRAAIDPSTGLPFTDGRISGFDQEGKFLGLAALAEDVQRGNLSRQREADLADVERLSGRFQDVMEDYRPGTTEALAGAREVLGLQQERLTGTRSATQADVDAETATEVGELISTGTPGGFQDPTFSADTQFSGALSAEQADDPKNDPLRAALLRDARGALDEGLTSREERQIAEAARARATMMGRTFDQSGAIAEAQARVQEDNQRRMQNRAFASQVLGQEAGLQTGDLGRGMQQELQQVGADMDAERLRQAQTAGFIDASTRLAALEASTTMDPFAALLNRAGGGSLAAGQGVFGAAGYGLDSGPQYLDPETGLGFISNMAANEANIFGAGLSADASRTAGLAGGFGNLVGSGIGALFCWVAREVYGPMNPQWMHFRDWMFAESPRWFFNLYRRFGERFANWISDKPRIKSIIRKWMDSKIGDK